VRDGETGLLVPFGDVDRLAERCLELLGDNDRRLRMSEAATEWAREHCSIDRCAREIENVYDRVMEGA
jgi:glycosyltransferase involved in cell wall biosynthesis